MISFKQLKTFPSGIFVSLTLFVILAFVLAACGSSTGSGGGSGTTSTTSTNSGSGSGYGGYGGGSNNPTPTSPPAATQTTGGSGSSALIHTATVTVNGKSMTILTNAKGLTLYYNTHDTATTTACSGGCASAWPPLKASNASALTSSTTLSGKLSIASNANGSQVEYNGHPLYTFASDTSAGQTSGEGIGGIWFVVPTNLS